MTASCNVRASALHWAGDPPVLKEDAICWGHSAGFEVGYGWHRPGERARGSLEETKAERYRFHSAQELTPVLALEEEALYTKHQPRAGRWHGRAERAWISGWRERLSALQVGQSFPKVLSIIHSTSTIIWENTDCTPSRGFPHCRPSQSFHYARGAEVAKDLICKSQQIGFLGKNPMPSLTGCINATKIFNCHELQQPRLSYGRNDSPNLIRLLWEVNAT